MILGICAPIKWCFCSRVVGGLDGAMGECDVGFKQEIPNFSFNTQLTVYMLLKRHFV